MIILSHIDYSCQLQHLQKSRHLRTEGKENDGKGKRAKAGLSEKIYRATTALESARTRNKKAGSIQKLHNKKS